MRMAMTSIKLGRPSSPNLRPHAKALSTRLDKAGGQRKVTDHVSWETKSTHLWIASCGEEIHWADNELVRGVIWSVIALTVRTRGGWVLGNALISQMSTHNIYKYANTFTTLHISGPLWIIGQSWRGTGGGVESHTNKDLPPQQANDAPLWAWTWTTGSDCKIRVGGRLTTPPNTCLAFERCDTNVRIQPYP